MVTAIIATLSVALLFNFGTTARSKTARRQVASIIASDIRRAQSMALSGTRFNGNIVCGYGIKYLSKTSYLIYAKTVPVSGSCASVSTRNYQTSPPADFIVESKAISNVNMEMEFRSDFSDIFFESPDPKTYINNSALLTDPPTMTTITIQRLNQASCGGQTCTKIEIYTSGQINLVD